MVFSDDFLKFLKIKKKVVEFTKTILWLFKIRGQVLFDARDISQAWVYGDCRLIIKQYLPSKSKLDLWLAFGMPT